MARCMCWSSGCRLPPTGASRARWTRRPSCRRRTVSSPPTPRARSWRASWSRVARARSRGSRTRAAAVPTCARSPPLPRRWSVACSPCSASASWRPVADGGWQRRPRPGPDPAHYRCRGRAASDIHYLGQRAGQWDNDPAHGGFGDNASQDTIVVLDRGRPINLSGPGAPANGYGTVPAKPVARFGARSAPRRDRRPHRAVRRVLLL